MNKNKEVIIYFDSLPIYISIENEVKFSSTYMSLCILRNKLIESNIIKRENRDNMFFYKKINNNNYLKVKEGELLDGILYLYIKEEKDYSEVSNILFHLEKRITNFEPKFKKSYEDFIYEHNQNNKDEKYNKYKIVCNLWTTFIDYNTDSFDYNDWYFIMKQDDIPLLRKMSLDIKKWLSKKEITMAEINLLYLNDLEYEINDTDINFVNNYLNDI